MDESTRLKLPYIMAAQAQKHITHNEAIRALDALVQIGVQDKDLTSPPASPNDGDNYIVASGATGEWAGHDGQLAAFQDNGWMFYAPRAGWLAWVMDENQLNVHNGSNWQIFSGGSSQPGASSLLNLSPHGAETRFEIAEEELSLSGSHVESTITIPNRAIVFGVSSRTTQAISGANSYDCGIASEQDKYGGSLSIAEGATNSGVTSPTAFYSPTPIRITANGSDFTGGKVRIAIHYMLCNTPTS